MYFNFLLNSKKHDYLNPSNNSMTIDDVRKQ